MNFNKAKVDRIKLETHVLNSYCLIKTEGGIVKFANQFFEGYKLVKKLDEMLKGCKQT